MYEMDEKCRKCKNNGMTICNRCDMFYDEFDPIDAPKQTNADRIRAMTDEELAEWIAHPKMNFCQYDICDGVTDCAVCVLAWLKQEVSE